MVRYHTHLHTSQHVPWGSGCLAAVPQVAGGVGGGVGWHGVQDAWPQGGVHDG